MVLLTVARNRQEAEVICGMLRSNGVVCWYEQTNFGAGSRDGMRGGPQQIVVSSRRDARRAKQLMRSPHGESLGVQPLPYGLGGAFGRVPGLERWLILVAASLVALYGLVAVVDAEQQWTSSLPHCSPSRPSYACVKPTSFVGGLNPWQEFGVGMGCLAVGACLFLLAGRVKRRRTVRPSPG